MDSWEHHVSSEASCKLEGRWRGRQKCRERQREKRADCLRLELRHLAQEHVFASGTHCPTHETTWDQFKEGRLELSHVFLMHTPKHWTQTHILSVSLYVQFEIFMNAGSYAVFDLVLSFKTAIFSQQWISASYNMLNFHAKESRCTLHSRGFLKM